MVKAATVLRTEICDAYNACKKDGIVPTPESVSLRVSPQAVPLVATTVRIVRLFERSGMRSARQLRKWAEAQKDDEDAAKGFSTAIAHDIAKIVFKQDAVADEDVREPEVVDDDSESSSAAGEGGENTAGGVATVDTGALELFERWRAQIDAAREAGEQAARSQEQTLARAVLEAEKEKAVLRERAIVANARLYACIAVVFALVVGVAIGVAYVARESHRVAPMQEGAQAPTTALAPPPSPTPLLVPASGPAEPDAVPPPAPAHEQPRDASAQKTAPDTSGPNEPPHHTSETP